MKKILLIEDRPGRQQQFLSAKDILELKEYVEFEENFRATVIEPLNDSKIPENFDEYDLYIFHRSALNPSGISTLLNYCKENNKNLILFSGSISQMTYNTENHQLLILNSVDFYSEKLIPFLKKYKNNEVENLLQLAYGDIWQLSLLLQYRQLDLNKSSESDDYRRSEIDEVLQETKKILTDIDFDNLDNVIDKIIAKL